MSFCLQGCPKILTYWSLQDEQQIDPFFHAWGSRGSSGAGKTAMGSRGRKGENVLLLRCCPWAWARQSRRFSPACPASLVWSPITTCGLKCLCAGVMSGAKVVLLVHRNAVSGARSQKRKEFNPWCFEWVEGIGNTDLHCGQMNLILSTFRGQIVGEKDGQSWRMMACLQLEWSHSPRSVQGQTVLSLVLSGTRYPCAHQG